MSALALQVENLDEILQEKENQLLGAQAKLASMHADQSSSDSALSSLEDSLADKERHIER